MAALKNFKNSKYVYGYFFYVLDPHGLELYRIGLGLDVLSLTYISGPFHYQLGPNFIFSVNNLF